MLKTEPFKLSVKMDNSKYFYRIDNQTHNSNIKLNCRCIGIGNQNLIKSLLASMLGKNNCGCPRCY